MGKELKNISGQKFNSLTAIKRVESSSKEIKYLFKCDCGNEKIIFKNAVVNGKTKSCGCLSNKKVRERFFKDLSGKVFGRLKVIEMHHTTRLGIYWTCDCVCGNKCVVLTTKLTNGNTVSCGCKRRETISNIEEINKSHEKSNTKLYKIYLGMKSRCYNKNSPKYNMYGGRGIKICKEWLDNFLNFYNWAIENGYSDELSIDRINVDGNYEPNNCRWASPKEQANNTRKTVFISYKGKTRPASEWSEITGIPQSTLTRRKRDGWSDEECIETKIGKKRA